MKILLTEKQADRIFNDKIECKKCEHSWKKEDDDSHPYLCHDCGWDQKKKEYDKENLFKFWKNKLSKKEIDEKWSQKYKKSINCNNPKGFSQRAHCQGRKKKNIKENLTEAERTFMAKLRDMAKKYAQGDSKDTTTKEKIEKIHQELKREFAKGIKVEKEHKSGDPKQIALDHLSEDPKYYSKLKKVETKEATGAGSSGSYESPAFAAKSMSPKDWRGKSKTQIPGGQFVEVKKKCKTFPYCNQGDINALKLSESKTMKRIIKNLSEKHGISESMVRDILIQDSKKNKK